jgi:hypothetical protein
MSSHGGRQLDGVPAQGRPSLLRLSVLRPDDPLTDGSADQTSPSVGLSQAPMLAMTESASGARPAM